MEKAIHVSICPFQQGARRHSSDFWDISNALAFQPGNNLFVKHSTISISSAFSEKELKFSPEKCSSLAFPTLHIWMKYYSQKVFEVVTTHTLQQAQILYTCLPDGNQLSFGVSLLQNPFSLLLIPIDTVHVFSQCTTHSPKSKSKRDALVFL